MNIFIKIYDSMEDNFSFIYIAEVSFFSSRSFRQNLSVNITLYNDLPNQNDILIAWTEEDPPSTG
jgi:hypothetical protein